MNPIEEYGTECEYLKCRIDQLERENAELKGDQSKLILSIGRIGETHDFYHSKNCHVEIELRNKIHDACSVVEAILTKSTNQTKRKLD